MEWEQTAVGIIAELRKQQTFEEDCLIKALRSIPEKYAKQLLKKYIELSEAGYIKTRETKRAKNDTDIDGIINAEYNKGNEK
jgi:hypothetical protein